MQARALWCEGDPRGRERSAGSTHRTIRVLLAGSNEALLRNFSECLGAEPDIWVVGIVARSDGVGRALEELRPDVLVVDVASFLAGETDTVALCAWVGDRTRILVLGSRPDGVRAALRAGARGYLLNDAEIGEIASAVRSLAHDRSFLSSTVATTLLTEELGAACRPPDSRIARLTDRECQILQLVAEGSTTREIARLLSLRVSAVRSHRKCLMRKLDLRNTVGIVRFAVSNHVIR